MNSGEGDGFLTHAIDKGDLTQSYIDISNFLNNDREGALQQNTWLCVNLINNTLEQIDGMTGCTEVEKNRVKGTLLYYRAWFMEELMLYYGPMPYVDYVLDWNEIVKLPRPSAKEAAEKCAADFLKAAELLPTGTEAEYQSADWSKTMRITSLTAKAYAGKVLLWAASPLNHLGAQTGALANGNTYKYDTGLARNAAQVLGDALNSIPQSPYALATFQFGDSNEMTGEGSTDFGAIDQYTYTWKGPQGSSVELKDGNLVVTNPTKGTATSMKYYLIDGMNIESADKAPGQCKITFTAWATGNPTLTFRLEGSTIRNYSGNYTAQISETPKTYTLVCDGVKSGMMKLCCMTGDFVGTIYFKDVNVETGTMPSRWYDIYEHQNNGSDNFYSDIFYTTRQNWKVPGAKEVLMRVDQGYNVSNWNFSKLWGPKVGGLVAHDQVIHLPTANYINYAYGMANGLPITDPESGFDPEQPFKDRDPRFYHDIVFDGCQYVNQTEGLNYSQEQYTVAQLFTGGNMRDEVLGSRTGYFCQKLVPHTANEGDRIYDWNYAFQAYLPYMRLSDVYLMYAEACAAYGDASTSNNCSLTAEQAINVLRDRVGAGHVAKSYTADAKKFMDEIRRERACELAFEGHRWSDLSRWLLLTEAPYNKKTSQEFTRVSGSDKDPATAGVSGWSEKEILARKLTANDYVFPLNPNTPPEIDIIYSEDGKTLIYYPYEGPLAKEERFVIPEHVEVLGENCFSGCRNLKEIVSHKGLKEIKAGALSGTSITSFDVPKTMTALPDRCFAGTLISDLNIHDGITSFGNDCYSGCINLTKVDIPEGVVSIGDKCFAIEKLEEISIPSSLVKIGKTPFYTYYYYRYPNLKTITVDEKNPAYTALNGVLYTKDMKQMIKCPNKYEGELVVPEGVTDILDLAIHGCTDLRRIQFPTTLKKLGDYNLSYCSQLKEVVCPAEQQVETNFQVSDFVSSMPIFYVPANLVSEYQSYAFDTQFVFKAIGSEKEYNENDFVFNFSTYYNVLFPKEEGGRMFTDEKNGYSGVESDPDMLSHITGICINGEEKNLNDYICTATDGGETLKALVLNGFGLCDVVLHTDGQLTEMPLSSLRLMHVLSATQLPKSIKRLTRGVKSDDVVEYSYWRSRIILPEHLEELADEALMYYQGTYIDIPKNVWKIGEKAFYRNSELFAVNVDPQNEHFTSVDGVLYTKDMSTLKLYPKMKQGGEFVVPEGVKNIDPFCASYYSWWGSDYNYNKFTHLILPSTIETIGDFAFEGRSMTVTCLATKVPKLSETAIEKIVRNYGVLRVPASALEDYKAADVWKEWFKIEPIEEVDAIESVTSSTETYSPVVRYYNAAGQAISAPQSGLNIMRKKDGTAIKVMKK